MFNYVHYTYIFLAWKNPAEMDTHQHNLVFKAQSS